MSTTRTTEHNFNIQEQAFYLHWILKDGDDTAVVFSVRMPTERWHYYLSLGINIHKYSPQGDNKCQFLGDRPCDCDGSYLAGDNLLKEYLCTASDSRVWAELESWLPRNRS